MRGTRRIDCQYLKLDFKTLYLNLLNSASNLFGKRPGVVSHEVRGVHGEHEIQQLLGRLRICSKSSRQSESTVPRGFGVATRTQPASALKDCSLEQS